MGLGAVGKGSEGAAARARQGGSACHEMAAMPRLARQPAWLGFLIFFFLFRVRTTTFLHKYKLITKSAYLVECPFTTFMQLTTRKQLCIFPHDEKTHHVNNHNLETTFPKELVFLSFLPTSLCVLITDIGKH